MESHCYAVASWCHFVTGYLTLVIELCLGSPSCCVVLQKTNKQTKTLNVGFFFRHCVSNSLETCTPTSAELDYYGVVLLTWSRFCREPEQYKDVTVSCTLIVCEYESGRRLLPKMLR